jgi:membrane protease YdiL (CAAX protease family)
MSYDATPALSQAAPPPLPDVMPRPIAHWTHTLALFLVLFLVAAFGHSHAQTIADSGGHILRYMSSILLEWLLLGSVIAGIYHRRAFFLQTFRNRSNSNLEAAGLGVVVYITGLMSIALVGGALYFTPLFHQRNQAVILAMLPHRPMEYLVWLVLSLTAGICEEIIFRGYLVDQFTVWTGRPIAAVLLAGLLFGSVHLYEGVGAILPLAALGIVYGFVVRHFKGDLRAVIVAHTLQDFLVPFFALAADYAKRLHPH